MDRSLWERSYCSSGHLPLWPCPVCGSGHVSTEPDTFKYEETADSIHNRVHPDWAPDWVEYIFSCWGKCSNLSCRQPFSIMGDGYISEVSEAEEYWGKFFRPLYCYPMPYIVPIPKKCPPKVAESLKSAFSLFWSNPQASAGCIRVSLEALMDHLDAPKKIKATKGKTVALNLHQRISQFTGSAPVNTEHLLALKWLGNSGSHGDGAISKTDLLDAFELIDHILKDIFDKDPNHQNFLAKKLTEKYSR